MHNINRISGMGPKSGLGGCAMDQKLYLRVPVRQSRGEHVLLRDQASRQRADRTRH